MLIVLHLCWSGTKYYENIYSMRVIFHAQTYNIISSNQHAVKCRPKMLKTGQY